MDILWNGNSMPRRAGAWMDLLLRWLLGGLFVVASYHKIVDPAGFAKIIFGYDLFPAASINLIAILLPYIELTAGLALILGVFPRAAAVLLSGLLLAFILVIGINAARGHAFDCGCFAAGESALWQNSPGWMLARNALLLLVGGCVTAYRGRRKVLLRAG